MGNDGPDWVAIAALFVAVVSAAFSVWWSIWSAKRSYVEGYWFREITAPSCIDPAIAIRATWCKQIEALSNSTMTTDSMQDFMGKLQTAVDAAIDEAWISQLFEGTLYAELVERLEAISDEVANLLATPTRAGHAISVRTAAAASEVVSEKVLWIIKRAAAANGPGLTIRKPSP